MYDDRTKELDRTVFFFDIILTTVTFMLAFWIRTFMPVEGELSFYSHLFLVPLLLALVICFLGYFGGYASPRDSTNFKYVWAVFKGVSLAVGVLLSLLFLLEIQYVSRIVIVIFSTLEFLALSLLRILIRRYFLNAVKSGKHTLQALIIGTGKRARTLARKLYSEAEWGVKVIGYIDPCPSTIGQEIEGVKIIGSVEDISTCLKEHVVDEVIMAIPRNLLEDAEPIAQACEVEGVKLRFMADVFSVSVGRMSLAVLGDIPLLTLEPVAYDDDKLIVKRIFDLVITAAALPLILPIMALVAIAIKLDSPGPALFIQQRVGLRKHLFPMMKFRSMRVDAEERLEEIEHLNEADGPIFKIKDDPRVTRVGKFIRKTSLDELPQLFNVLRGEMSLVGPRPMSIRDVDLFDKGIQRKRFSVKPGITCIWQISGRSDLPFHKWLQLDLKYIETWSLMLDLEILLKTIPAVLKSRGAA